VGEDYYGCVLVDPGVLRMERVVSDGIPALRIDEYVEVAGQEPWVSTSYFGPAVARIQDVDVEILLDLAAGLVAFADSNDSNWRVESLEDWQDHIENLRATARSQLSPEKPRYWSAEKGLVAGLACRQYRLVARRQRPGTAGEHLEQDLWMTRDIETTREIYATYRRTLQLFDRMLIDMPADLPPGIILRSHLLRRSLDSALGDAGEVEDATVFDVGYELLPREFFVIDAREVVWPAAAEEGR
jgi:hypothetical protein